MLFYTRNTATVIKIPCQILRRTMAAPIQNIIRLMSPLSPYKVTISLAPSPGNGLNSSRHYETPGRKSIARNRWLEHSHATCTRLPETFGPRQEMSQPPSNLRNKAPITIALVIYEILISCISNKYKSQSGHKQNFPLIYYSCKI